MKFLLTGLLWAAINGWLFAQAPAVSISGDAVPEAAGPTLREGPDRLARKAGYQVMAELGAGKFTGSTFSNYVKAEVINGLHFGPYFYGGIGTGIRLITEQSSFWGTMVYPMVPFYLDMRLYASRGNVSPYLAMDVGYSFDLSNGIEGLGMMYNPMAGLALARHKRIPVYLELGYNAQIMDDNRGLYPEKGKAFGALVVDVGLQF